MNGRRVAAAGIVALAAIGMSATVGQAGRDAFPALDRLPAWAGGRRDVVACERAIVAALPAGAGYRRLATDAADTGPLSQAQFDREAGLDDAAPPAPRSGDPLDRTLATRDRLAAMQAQLDRDRAAGHELRLRRLRIDYDPGTGRRGTAICHIRLIDGAPEPAELLMARATRQASAARRDAALALIGRDGADGRNRALPCCL